MKNLFWKAAGLAAAVGVAAMGAAAVNKLVKARQETMVQPMEAEPVPAEEAAAEAAPAENTVVYPAVVPGGETPNPNPVEAPKAQTPRTADGKIDVTRLCDPADFCDWDDLGCRS